MQQAKRPEGHAKKRKNKKDPHGLSDEQQKLVDEYFEILARQRSLREFFERITDPELISVCVYEMNAVQRQYAYILSRLKEEEVTYLKILR